MPSPTRTSLSTRAHVSARGARPASIRLTTTLALALQALPAAAAFDLDYNYGTASVAYTQLQAFESQVRLIDSAETVKQIDVMQADQLVTQAVFTFFFDPFARIQIEAWNPFDTAAAFRYYISIPTTRMIDEQWRADAQLSAVLTDGNGDGAVAMPDVMVFDPANPFARPQVRFMDTAVNLVIGATSFLGGPPVAPLGGAALVASADGIASFEQRSSADALPSHDFIGPDVAWNTLYLTVAFKLSPHDRIALDARIDVTEIRPVPEPATWALCLAGGATLLALLRRRAVAQPSG